MDTSLTRNADMKSPPTRLPERTRAGGWGSPDGRAAEAHLRHYRQFLIIFLSSLRIGVCMAGPTKPQTAPDRPAPDRAEPAA